MRRTNIYLPDDQLAALKALGRQRGEPMSELVREAVGGWLAAQGVRVIDEDDWGRRLEALLDRRREVAGRVGAPERTVERDVSRALTEARRARSSRRS
jgi:hypothetical protein